MRPRQTRPIKMSVQIISRPLGKCVAVRVCVCVCVGGLICAPTHWPLTIPLPELWLSTIPYISPNVYYIRTGLSRAPPPPSELCVHCPLKNIWRNFPARKHTYYMRGVCACGVSLQPTPDPLCCIYVYTRARLLYVVTAREGSSVCN